MSAEQIEHLTAQVELYRKKWETVQLLIDCRVCDHYRHGYLPCTSTVQCYGGDMWTRTKVVHVWTNAELED